jgi:hypothetical protein
VTDPERISKRSGGLAAQLLRAGADEQPADTSVQQTLAALGVSAAVVSSTGAAGAVVGSAKATSALGAGAGTSAVMSGTAAGGAVKAVSATLLVKWIGIGVVSGVGLAGAAAVASGPVTQASASRAALTVAASSPPSAVAATTPAPERSPLSLSAEAPVVSAPAPLLAVAPRASVSEPVVAPALEIGAPLAAEVAYVDRARALLASGQVEPGLTLLRSYERDFPEARLLPEVLFLQLETCDRMGRKSEARAAAQRLLDGFPKSPHASRARKLLFP